MKIIVIDDDPIVSMSLKTILESHQDIEVVAIGQDGSEAMTLYQQHRPDILLMDIQMKHQTGLEAARMLLQHDPDIRIAFLTTFSDADYIQEAIQLGVKGYLLKQDFSSIHLALESILAGQVVFGHDVIGKFQSVSPKFSNQDELSEREQALLAQIAQGLNNKELALHFGYSEGTIRNQISLLLEKLEVRDRTQLVIYYFNHLK